MSDIYERALARLEGLDETDSYLMRPLLQALLRERQMRRTPGGTDADRFYDLLEATDAALTEFVEVAGEISGT